MASDDEDVGGRMGSGDDVMLPKATVNKFINELASTLDVRLALESRELLVQVCTEFVQLLSSEANDVCERDQKKTITGEHVLRALTELGLDSESCSSSEQTFAQCITLHITYPTLTFCVFSFSRISRGSSRGI